MVEAARSLFEEIGFQETTIRMIAERGGVFTTFEDKVAILCQIVSEYREKLFEEIEALADDLEGTARDRLHAVLTLAHRHEFPRLRLVVAYIGASYGWSRNLEEDHRQLHRRLALVTGRLVREGVERGEIGAHVDPDLMIEMLSSTYLRNYRTAYYAGLSLEDLDARTARQLDLLFEGARPR